MATKFIKPKYRGYLTVRSTINPVETFERFTARARNTRKEALLDACLLYREVKTDPKVVWGNDVETYGTLYDWDHLPA